MTTVRFTAGPLGTVADIGGARFTDEAVAIGDVGELLPDEETVGAVPDGWRMARVEVPTETDGLAIVRYVPVHPSHYEEVGR